MSGAPAQRCVRRGLLWGGLRFSELAGLLTLLWAFAAPAWVAAHDVRPGAVSVREVAAGEYVVRLVDAQDGGATTARLDPEWPDHCTFQGVRLACDGGLRGELRIPEAGRRRIKVMVTVTDLAGQRRQWLLMEGEDRVNLDETGEGPPVWSFVWIGVEHIWWGPDHLLFVLGLWLLAPTWRRCLWAATGFTVGHSLTLVLVTLGWLAPISQAVELVIALSVLSLATEVAALGVADASGQQRRAEWWRSQTWTMRWPAAVGAIIGLVHGMGFAGALRDVGLPAGQELGALALFNAGVELGQLAVILALGLLWWALEPRLGAAFGSRCRLAAAYAMGCTATVWSLERWVG